MLDITQKPYHCYNEEIKQLSIGIQSQADVRFIGFSRVHPNRERFMICSEKDWNLDLYNRKLYRYGLYEKPIHELVSGFNMWDHLPYAPPEVYGHARSFGIAHGLTILQQHGDYCDSFVFATRPGNSLINNFYLNQKELLLDFIKDFYNQMAILIIDLENHKITMPNNPIKQSNPVLTLTVRQRECALLLAQGSKTKEIAKKLLLSPRTVESHIDTLREKFQVKNRPELIYAISKIL